MAKEKEIWLDPEEIRMLLEGGLYWNDIESKFARKDSDSLKQRIDNEDIPDIDEIITDNRSSNQQRDDNGEAHNDEDVRAILLGETPVRNPEIEQNGGKNLIKDRQIDFSNMQEEIQRPFIVEAAVTEEEKMEKPGKNDDILIGADERQVYEEQQMGKAFYGLPPAEESEVGWDEKNNFSGLGAQAEYKATIPDRPFNNLTYDDIKDEEEDKGSAFGGLKLVILLVVVALVTFGFWYYFISK